MEDLFLTDKPVSDEIEDKFQRYNFSKRIAEIILSRTSKESIVIGLYGAWGEGKTSVLNFIRKKLNEKSSDIIQFTFNPWRFTDEAALLISFFNTLAIKLKEASISENAVLAQTEMEKKSFFKRWLEKRKKPLQTDKEAIGEFIKKYGRIVSVMGAGEAAEAIGKAISDVDIEELKARIENLLSDNKKKIVVIIDDIDRLEKNEIHSIFRLVKLTGDFAYTTYILSFDENIVSAAIGERFGTGDQKAGFNFLEKIVQIPLTLPLAQKTALQDYCFKLVQQSLDSSQIVLSDESAEEFSQKFSTNFLKRLTTPRLAVRYGNTLSFSLPLLIGEVNYVDLLLIEAFRVFYPELYNLIRTKPDFFLGDYPNDSYLSQPRNSKAEKLKELFDEATKTYKYEEIADAKAALKDLFPNLKQVWGANWSYGVKTSEMLYSEKRIASSQYFNRYFSYVVILGDISDVSFNNFIENMSNYKFDENLKSLKQILESVNPEKFISKFRFTEKSLDDETATEIVKLFCELGDFFPDKITVFLIDGPLAQASIFISQLIKHQIEDSKKIELMNWVIERATPFKFAYKIFNYCRGKEEDSRIFTKEEYTNLASKLIDRAKALSNNKPIWETFNSESKYMLNTWAVEFDKEELGKYIKMGLDKDAKSVILFLKVFVGFIHSSASRTPYYGDFTEESYNWLKGIVSPEIIYSKVENLIGPKLHNITGFKPLEHEQNDKNLMEQFVYWYSKDISG
jgi:predicted KAP-like P-loop ATPase